MKHLLLLSITAIVSFGQLQTPLYINPGAGSAPGEIRLRARKNQPGDPWVGIKARQDADANESHFWPRRDGTAGHCMQTDGAYGLSFGPCDEKVVSDYNWIKSVGSITPGTLTVTWTENCPTSGSDTSYKFRVSSSLAWEIVTSDGAGTCVRGGAGTITGTVAGTYASASAQSASAGWQESIYSVADSNSVFIRAKIGNYDVYTDIVTQNRNVTATCDSPSAYLTPRADNLKTFNVASSSAIRIYNCGINNSTYLHSGVTGVYLNNPTGSSFGGRIQRMELFYLEDAIHLVTGYLTDVLDNRVTQADHAALWIENIDTGDAGIGKISGNNMSCLTSCAHGLLWNSPGALQFKDNGLNGFTEQVTLDPHHGYATAVNSAGNTNITWVSGNKFRPSMVGYPVQVGDVNSCTVDTFIDDEHVVCVGQTIGPITNQRYYHGGTGQVQIMGNLFDGFSNTTHGVRWLGGIYLFNSQIEQNFIANYNNTAAKGISIESSGVRILSIKNNNIQSAYNAGWTTVGINVVGSSDIHLSGNQVSGYVTGVNVGAAALSVTVDGDRVVSSTTPFTSAASTAIIRTPTPITYAQLSALTVANFSAFGCTDCQPTSASDSTCTSGGTGAIANRLDGAWMCSDGSPGTQWTESGSDLYRLTGDVGIGLNNPTQKLDVFGTSAAPATTGTAQTGIARFQGNATNTLDFGMYSSGSFGAWLQATNVLGLGTTYPLHLNPNGGMVDAPGGFGTYGAVDTLLRTDNVTRWRLKAAGDIVPEANDQYNIGDRAGSKIVSGVEAKYGNFYKAGSTSSTDYVTTRKVVFLDLAGGSGAWDVQASGSMASTSKVMFRDNAGSRWLEGWRALSGSPLNYTSVFSSLVPAKRDTGSGDAVTDAVFPNLGGSSNPWEYGYIKQLVLSGDVSFGTPSTVNFGNTGTRALRMFVDGITTGGTTYFENGSNLILRATNTLTIDSCTTVGHVLTAGVSGVMTCQAAGGLPVVDTTAIAKGSVDATKQVRFEVDGLSSGVVRVLTPQDNNYTIAGTNIAQTFSGANTFSVGQTFAGGFQIQGNITTNSSGSYSIGSSGDRLNNIFTNSFTLYSTGLVQSGATFNIQSGGTLAVNSGGSTTANGNSGVSVSGASCTVKRIDYGIVTDATCP